MLNSDENGANNGNGGTQQLPLTPVQQEQTKKMENHDSINGNCVGAKRIDSSSIEKRWRDPVKSAVSANMQETNEWANSILKELDSLRTNGRQSDPASFIGRPSATTVRNISKVAPTLDLSKTTIITSPLPSPTSPTSPTIKRSTIINVTLRKSTPVPAKLDDDKNSATNTDHNNILKPEKHVSDFSFLHIFLFLIFVLHTQLISFSSNCDIQIVQSITSHFMIINIAILIFSLSTSRKVHGAFR